MLFALIFPRAQRTSRFDISAEQNVYMATVGSAIVCDCLRNQPKSYGNQPLKADFHMIADDRGSQIAEDRKEICFHIIADDRKRSQSRL